MLYLVDGAISLSQHIIQELFVVFFPSLVQHQPMALDWDLKRTL